MTQPTNSPAQAPDAAIDRRPGYPMEREPQPIANAHWLVPDKQRPQANVLMEPGRTELTATFGTEHPPRGISGLLRRAAYTLPDYRAKRWMLLIFADRVDAVEAQVLRVAKHPATWLLLAGAAGGWFQLTRGRSRSRFSLR